MGQINVLIAEDEQDCQLLIQELVQSREELTLDGVSKDGHDTLNKILSGNYDLVLLDIKLPGISGIKILEILSKSGKMPYVIFTTGYTEYAIEAFEYSALDFLVKPITLERFNLAIDKFLTNYENHIKLFKNNEKIIQRNITYGIIYNTICDNLRIQNENKKNAAEYTIERKILLIDHDEANFQLLKNILCDQSCSMDTTFSESEAFYKLEKNNYDLVLLSQTLPGMSGLDVCRKLRLSFNFQELPVLMLMPKKNTADISALFSAGANDYVVQPFDKDELAYRVNSLIALKDSVSQINELKSNIETIMSNIPEGIMLLNTDLEITYSNGKIKELFLEKNIKTIKDLSDKEILGNIYDFSKKKNNKLIFEWITGSPEHPVLISMILQYINEKFILLVIYEIKNVLTKTELQNCYYIIRGYSERETAKLLYKGRTTVNSNKVRAIEKLKQTDYTTLLKYLK